VSGEKATQRARNYTMAHKPQCARKKHVRGSAERRHGSTHAETREKKSEGSFLQQTDIDESCIGNKFGAPRERPAKIGVCRIHTVGPQARQADVAPNWSELLGPAQLVLPWSCLQMPRAGSFFAPMSLSHTALGLGSEIDLAGAHTQINATE